MRTLDIQQYLACQFGSCADSEDQYEEKDAQLAHVGGMGDIV